MNFVLFEVVSGDLFVITYKQECSVKNLKAQEVWIFKRDLMNPQDLVDLTR